MSFKIALVTMLHMAAECRRAARLDGGHGLQVGSWERVTMPIRFATFSEDVGEFISLPATVVAPGPPLPRGGRHAGLPGMRLLWRVD
jgi:hypothetical protein